eukprot:CAMPEP_0177745062 /NCGR_PEP_ID=MMETSP0484_2-20121128/30099_1 /TAXON_ID=354590 /ORGANISM="Rhodomonas lens, Strain RHODO" /LENGTH=263 /DNA_ID=CAMNT_0019259647 /DNA_START=243 /DNA_END=1031 /DNA_ORIENTATION=+
MADIVEKARQKLLNKKRILANEKREREIAVMMGSALEAAKVGDVKALEALLDGGMPVNTLDKYGGTVMHWAAGTGQLAICQMLLARGADPNIRLSKGGGRGRTVLHYAARNGHLDVCTWLVEAVHIPADVPTHDGTTPLQLAVWKGHLPVCNWLVHTKGVDPHQVNGYGCNGSHWAALGGSMVSAKWLKEEGVNLSVKNLVGHTALHKAAQGGHGELCEWLLAHAPHARHTLSQTDSEGKTPAELAGEQRYGELEAWLRAQEE